MPSKTTIDYIFKGIPRDLWGKAQAKAAAQRPPISMKWVLLQALEKFVSAGSAPTQEYRKKPVNRASDPPAKASIKRRAKNPTPVGAALQDHAERLLTRAEPDLGDSF